MEVIIPVLLAILVTAGVTSGIWIALRRSNSKPSISSSDSSEATPERYQAYTTRFELARQWRNVLTEVQRSLEHVTTVEEMAQQVLKAIHQEFPQAGSLIALGPLTGVALLHAMPGVAKPLSFESGSFVLSDPDLVEALAYELAREVHDASTSLHPQGKRWASLADLSPALQQHLFPRYQMPGPGTVHPFWTSGTAYGLFFFSCPPSQIHPDIVREHGEQARVLADLLAVWIRCMAPHLLSNDVQSPANLLPLEALATLTRIEDTMASLEDQVEAEEMLGELAAFSHFSLARAVETSILAAQSCASLRRASQADCAMCLIPNEHGGFSVEAMECEDWKWTRLDAIQHRQVDHPLLSSKSDLLNWPDRFVTQTSTQGKVLLVETGQEITRVAARLAEQKMVSLIAMPAIINGKCLAILLAGRLTPGGFSTQVQAVGSSITAISAITLRSMQAQYERETAQQKQRESWNMMTTLTVQMLTALGGVTKAHGILTLKQPQAVSTVAELIAKQMRLDPLEISHIRIAASLCDLGMLSIPTSILRKEGNLTPEEWALIQGHPQATINLIQGMSVLKDTLDIIAQHHERWDGSGYPQQLKGTDISLGARVLGVADTFVSMQIKRPQRNALSQDEALRQIEQGIEKTFDPVVVRALLKACQKAQESEPKVA